jgi:hypothetical protein
VGQVHLGVVVVPRVLGVLRGRGCMSAHVERDDEVRLRCQSQKRERSTSPYTSYNAQHSNND